MSGNPFVKDDAKTDSPFATLFTPLAEEIGRLTAERTALRSEVDNLRGHIKEAKDWLAANWEKYCAAKANYEQIKESFRKIADGPFGGEAA